MACILTEPKEKIKAVNPEQRRQSSCSEKSENSIFFDTKIKEPVAAVLKKAIEIMNTNVNTQFRMSGVTRYIIYMDNGMLDSNMDYSFLIWLYISFFS